MFHEFHSMFTIRFLFRFLCNNFVAVLRSLREVKLSSRKLYNGSTATNQEILVAVFVSRNFYDVVYMSEM